MKEGLPSSVPKVKRVAVRVASELTSASLRQDLEWKKELQTVFSPDMSPYRKAKAALDLLINTLPGSKKLIQEGLLRIDTLPFDMHAISYIGSGAKNDVFKIDIDEKHVALKLDRLSYGKSLSNLEDYAKITKLHHARVQSTFGDIKEFIPPELQIMILNGPVLGQPVVAKIQQFLAGPLKGIYEDYSFAELKELLKKHISLKDTFRQVDTISTRLLEETGECLDVLGVRNLCITKQEDEPHLVYVDPDALEQFDNYSLREKQNVLKKLNLLHNLSLET